MRSVCFAAAMVAVAVLPAVSPVIAQSQKPGGAVTSFYDLKTQTLTGKPADLGQYRGKVSLVVNVASKCGFTPQYEGLEKLQREMQGKNFNVLGFPSNDFGGQEPGTRGGDPDLLQADLRRDVPDVRESRDEARRRPVADLFVPRTTPASCRRGISRST